MKTKRSIVAKIVGAGVLAFAAAQYSVAEAETEKVEIYIKDIKVEDSVYTPFYEVETEQDHSQGSAQRWIRLGVYFTTEGGWIDEIDVRQLAHIPVDKKSKSILLEETVHYINIAPGDHYVYVYLHPSYVERYDIDDSDMDSAAQISINGKVVAQIETAREVKKGWSNLAEGVETKNYLLNHAETPFWFINYDFKEIIKQED